MGQHTPIPDHLHGPGPRLDSARVACWDAAMSDPRRALDPPPGELTLLSTELMEAALAQSRISARRRVILPLHKEAGDTLHRMLNAVQPGSYIRPHRHLGPPKAECFVVLRGALAFLTFAEDGAVRDCVHVEAGASPFGVDLSPGVYHGFVALAPDTLIFEAKPGPYVASTDKEFAPWAPEEGSPHAAAYLDGLLQEHARRSVGRDTPALARIDWRPPLLQSERLVLRGYELTDAEAIHAYASDPDTTRYMAWQRHGSVDDAFAFLNGFVAASYQRRDLDYALCLADAPERAIGGLGLYVRSERHRSMELGYILSRSHWGRGLLPEAARLLIDHAFASCAVERIYAPIFAENARSRRAAEKIGLRLEGVLRSALDFHGRRWDEAIYAVLRSEWRGSRP
jgi:cupin fold WbuC family metalloprotein